jgi:hypothetical protein
MGLPGLVLAHTFASPCLGREPKARVATTQHGLGIINMQVVIVEFDMIKLFNFLLPF